jgi:hypothetical protein
MEVPPGRPAEALLVITRLISHSVTYYRLRSPHDYRVQGDAFRNVTEPLARTTPSQE